MIVDFQEKLVSQECLACGITFAFTATVDRQLRQSKRLFKCPNGHDQSYVRGEIDDLRDRVAGLERDLENSRQWSAGKDERIAVLSRSNASLQGVITKLRARK